MISNLNWQAEIGKRGNDSYVAELVQSLATLRRLNSFDGPGLER